MTRPISIRTRINAARTWIAAIGLTAAVAAVTVIAQSPAGSEGWHIPEGAVTETNPQAMNPAAIASGHSVYKAKCQRCHGSDGAGHGPDGDRDHPPADLTDRGRASRNPDGVMFYKIWNGRAKPRMPAMKAEITRVDVWNVIAYVKTLRK